MIDKLKQYNTTKLFCIYIIFVVSFFYMQHIFLVKDDLYYDALSSQLSNDRIEQILDFQKKWAWVSYCFFPLLYLIKFALIGCCLLSGTIFFNLKISFSDAFKIALLSDVVFIFPIICKLIWFLFFNTNYTLEDVQRFSPLSLMNLFDYKSIGGLWIYPLETINFFELAYIFLLGFWLFKFGTKDYEKGLNIAFLTYLPALIIWIIIVMFVTVSINPQI